MIESPDYIHLDVERCFNDISSRLDKRARIQVRGEVGAGKTKLAYLLGERLDALVIEPPDLDEDDAVAHALLQASRKKDVPIDGKRSVRENTEEIARALESDGQLVVLRLPATWRLDQKPRHAHQQRLLDAARSFIESWYSNEKLNVVLIADQPQGMPRGDIITLSKGQAQREMLDHDVLWGAYANAARELKKAIGREWNDPSPVSLRLTVGLVALGEPPSLAAQLLLSGRPPGSLVSLILERASVRELIPSLQRFSLIRTAVPVKWVEEITKCPADHLPLLTQCLGYGNGNVRISRSVSQTLQGQIGKRSSLGETLLPPTHEKLARLYRSLDGATDPNETGKDTIVCWLEKVHHLAHGGAACAEEWKAQTLQLRDHLCERARVLSRNEHRYREAAHLYERIVEEIDRRDAYAWHYLGFNLYRSAADRKQIEKAYKKALELDPTNPWWNSRYLTFLIEQARFTDADEAWERAMTHIDPDGVESDNNPDLALHLHRWVAQAWLDQGEVERARRVLDRLLDPAFELAQVRDVQERIKDAEEALSLGASVRPPDMPMDERWKPVVLPDKDDQGTPLSRWFAGRVEEVDQPAQEIRLVFATTDEAQEKRRLLRKTISITEWNQATTLAPSSATGKFIEIGEYGERLVILPVASFTRRAGGITSNELRYLKRWSAE